MRIKTANALWAGTDDEIWINIKGTKGETQKRHLDNPFINDFERGFESMSQFFYLKLYLVFDSTFTSLYLVWSVLCPGGEHEK